MNKAINFLKLAVEELKLVQDPQNHPNWLKDAEEFISKQKPVGNFVSQFKVVAISENTNAFGLRGIVIIDKTGLSFRIGMADLNKPTMGEVLDVTLNERLSIQSIAGKSFEIPHRLPHAPANVLKEVFSEEVKPVVEDKPIAKTYKLNVKETGNKAGKYHYTITDETGSILSERKSNRQYVAATINGQFYFGRTDLIGKGEHGRQLKRSPIDQHTPIAHI